MQVVFTSRAARHAAGLHAYISEHSGAARADAYLERIVAFCGQLRTFPERGTRRDDLMPGLRTIGFERRMTVAFLVTEDMVLIEALFYGGQDFEATYRD